MLNTAHFVFFCKLFQPPLKFHLIYLKMGRESEWGRARVGENEREKTTLVSLNMVVILVLCHSCVSWSQIRWNPVFKRNVCVITLARLYGGPRACRFWGDRARFKDRHLSFHPFCNSLLVKYWNSCLHILYSRQHTSQSSPTCPLGWVIK